MSDLLTRSIGSLSGIRQPREEPRTVKQPRLRLWEMPTHFHCPVIGTCLSIADLERAIRKAGIEWTKRPRDIDIHHAAVHKASENCRLSRILNKLLEKRYQRFVKQTAGCSTTTELHTLWRNALSSGDLPGTFWAILTHPQADEELLETVYGDVHMLSHLNGASHRAELTRLAALERENEGLRSALNKSRSRGDKAISERDARIRHLEGSVLKLQSRLVDDIGSRFLSEQLDAARRSAARAELRAERTERRLADREFQIDEYAQNLAALRELLEETRSELALAEKRMESLLQGYTPTEKDIPRLEGRRVIYIGGRPSLTPHMRELVERMDGHFIHHDGGQEDSRAVLEEVVQSADLVFCPTDCISHDACLRAKNCCRRTGALFMPLRSSGISSFAVGLEKAAQPLHIPKSN